jgi:hypothetical protein
MRHYFIFKPRIGLEPNVIAWAGMRQWQDVGGASTQPLANGIIKRHAAGVYLAAGRLPDHQNSGFTTDLQHRTHALRKARGAGGAGGAGAYLFQ